MSRERDPFQSAAIRYDAWYDENDGRIIFEREVECLRRVMTAGSGRWLEVGVGTGRFAVALNVSDGVDPSDAMRALAERRGIRTVNAVGECLPYADGSFDGALMTTTLCFVADPEKAFQECCRVLTEAGCLVVGLIPANSPWGRLYARKAAEGHEVYSAATFHTPEEVVGLAGKIGLELRKACSCLLTPPGPLGGSEQPYEGINPSAGFVAMAFSKRQEFRS